MAVWALSDLHLALSVPSKTMEVFGEPWLNYLEKIQKHWSQEISTKDLVLIPGDISWAMQPEEALIDLKWIDELPGTKVVLRGNHDYWWTSLSKLKKILPPSIHPIQNNSFEWEGISIGGSRLWDTPEYDFSDYVVMKENPLAKKCAVTSNPGEDEKVFIRELGRLEASLKTINQHARIKIAMTHYPPIGADLKDSRASCLLGKYHIDICVFGHMHNVRKEISLFGESKGIKYIFAAADYLNFTPIKLCE